MALEECYEEFYEEDRVSCKSILTRKTLLMVSPLLSVPVSQPSLTHSAPRNQAFSGDMLELLCEDNRASPPILYWFYRENIALGNISMPFGGAASFSLSLTIEHSGNYYCEADNGLGPQRSEAVPLKVTGKRCAVAPFRGCYC